MTNDVAKVSDARVAARAERLLDEAVGESLDRLATLDLHGDDLVGALYRAACGVHRGPLALGAAQALSERTSVGDRVVVLTGFLSPVPETDGLIGSAILAVALERGLGILPVFVAEDAVLEPLRAAVRAAGLNVVETRQRARELPHAALLLPFPREEVAARAEAERLATELAPSAVVAVERPGANPQGAYHYSGGARAPSSIAPLDLLYLATRARGALTVGIGDRGNELGMGAIADAVRRETPAGGSCGCGCGGGTACETPADRTVVASTSDWGAYAIAAALMHLTGDASLLVSGETHRRIVDRAIDSGAIDGPTKYAVPLIDAVDETQNLHVLELLRSAVAFPNRASTSPSNRLFRAHRLLSTGE